jgi:hypothetical protein|tara:strand:+ start:853 stop:1089 length:237 start_codon:yes stop_codon:yes gene_type:complete
MEKVKPYQGLAWTGTAILLIAATMASFNMYPYYSYAFCLANAIWVVVGVLWKEKSLIVLNAGLTLIYIIGIIQNLIAQ